MRDENGGWLEFSVHVEGLLLYSGCFITQNALCFSVSLFLIGVVRSLASFKGVRAAIRLIEFVVFCCGVQTQLKSTPFPTRQVMDRIITLAAGCGSGAGRTDECEMR